MKYKKWDIVEVEWLDSHSGSGWKTPSEVKQWIEGAKDHFTILSVGYFLQEDENFFRICQSHDFQHLREEGEGDDNVDAIFAIAKTAIKSIKKLKCLRNQK